MNDLKQKLENLNERVKALEDAMNNNESSIRQCRDITDTNKLDIDDLKKKMNIMSMM
jgi:chromosome segregation ATPase